LHNSVAEINRLWSEF